MLTSLLFETPWWLPIAFIGIGLILLWAGNNRQDKGMLRGGLAIAIVGVLVMIVSYVVETPRELAIRRTRSLVAAASAKDWNAMRAGLDPETSIYGLRGPDAIVESAQRATQQYELGSFTITSLESTVSSTLININIRVFGQIYGQPIMTDWQFQYADLGNGWRLRNIQAVTNKQFNEEQIRSHMPH